MRVHRALTISALVALFVPLAMSADHHGAPTASAASGGFSALSAPARVLDTRPGTTTFDDQFAGIGEQGSETTLRLPVADRAGIPADATTVALNITAAGATAPGYITIHPCGTPLPNASNINFDTGQTLANSAIARLGPDGDICIYTYGITHVIVDVTGHLPSAGDPRTTVPLGDVVGLALREASAARNARADVDESDRQGRASQTELLTVASDGSVSLAFPSGDVDVARLLVDAERAFMTFDFPGATISGTVGCMLASLDLATGIVDCIDADTDGVYWGLVENLAFASRKSPVQTDAAGAVYYLAATDDGVPELRRTAAGLTSSVVDRALAFVDDFLVLDDGSTIVYGRNRTGGGEWLRRYTPSGGIQPLPSMRGFSFLRRFPDGNAYFGDNEDVRRFLTANGQVDPEPWISSFGDSGSFLARDICEDVSGPSSFCTSATDILDTYTTPDGTVIAITKHELVSFYPTVQIYDVDLDEVTVAAGSGQRVAVAGFRTAGRPGLDIIDLGSGAGTTVLPPSIDIEIFRIGYVSASNSVMFDGLRYSDGRYVLGQVSLDDLSYEISPLPGGRLTDFQTF